MNRTCKHCGREMERRFAHGVGVCHVCPQCDFGVCSCGLSDPSGKANLCRCGAWIRLLPETCEVILREIDDLPTTYSVPNN